MQSVSGRQPRPRCTAPVDLSTRPAAREFGESSPGPDTVLTAPAYVHYADRSPVIRLQIISGTADSAPYELTGPLLDGSARESSRFEVLDQVDVPAVPDPATCRTLEIASGSTAFCIEGRLESADGAPIRQRAFIRPDRYSCILHFTAT